MVADIAGVYIQGLGEGTARPTITFTTVAGADIDIEAANITFDNFIFDATGVNALTGPIDVNAAYFTMKNCQIEYADASNQCLDFIVANTLGDNMLIKDNYFHATTDANGQSMIQLTGCDAPWIVGNVMHGDTVIATVEVVGTAATRIYIADNDMENFNSTDQNILLISNTTGTIRYNTLRLADNGQTTWINGTNSCQLYENYMVNANGEVGTAIAGQTVST